MFLDIFILFHYNALRVHFVKTKKSLCRFVFHLQFKNKENNNFAIHKNPKFPTIDHNILAIVVQLGIL